MLNLLREAKQALINRDAVKCYNPLSVGECQCTICKIDRFIENFKNVQNCKPYDENYWNARFAGGNVPEKVKKAITRIYGAYPSDCLPQGLSDPMYIMNIICLELGIGDGCGNFSLDKNFPEKVHIILVNGSAQVCVAGPIQKAEQKLGELWENHQKQFNMDSATYSQKFKWSINTINCLED